MPIHGLSENRRLPRLGKIKMGYIDTSRARSFPRATDYFVCPPEVQAIHGEYPQVIEPVLIPVEDEDVFASTYYRYYTQSYGLTCKGDGETANRLIDVDESDRMDGPVPASGNTERTERRDVPCPCPLLDSRQCRPIMNLQLILPKVPGLGIWQLDTSSFNSIKNVLGSLAIIRSAAGRLTGIPLKLSMEKTTVTPRGMKSKTVNTLKLEVSQQYSAYSLAKGPKR